MRIQVFGLKGDRVKDLEVNLNRSEISRDAILTLLRVQMMNRRKYRAVARTRGDVSGGGKKPWRQKGTGRARQGSTRSPIWRGGGVAHGPKGSSPKLKINKMIKKNILAAVIAETIGSGKAVVLNDGLDLNKTKDMVDLISRLKLKRGKSLFLTTNPSIVRVSRNIKNIILSSPQNINLYSLLNASNVIITEEDLLKISRDFSL